MAKERTVLVVEDDDGIREAVRGALLDDCNVVCVSTVAAARRLLTAIRFDAVLLDLLLGREHGEELLHSMATEEIPASPVVVVSASREANRIARGYGVPFLPKPFEVDAVLAALDEASTAGTCPRIRA